jgi:hypothetical protein
LLLRQLRYQGTDIFVFLRFNLKKNLLRFHVHYLKLLFHFVLACVAPGHVWKTGAGAATGGALTTESLKLYMYVSDTQQPELHLDVSTLQRLLQHAPGRVYATGA